MYICTLPILWEHERLSAIVEWTQSDHSDYRHWMEGVSTTKPGTESFFFQHLTGQKLANRLKVTGYQEKTVLLFYTAVSVSLASRVTSHMENLEKSGNFTLVRENSGKLGKVEEIVVCLFYATAVAIVTI